ncbi:tripartite tricarboxylate transporter substrate binding protein [Roseomonas sp. KE0001]|uniref:Bug family tripartite tricarboxylate transporter substrate binding protein n=1 Tax=Roseomonas sp. KE0001 TaxID=2479201 RepID=UPI0018DF4332|nr:tripartite tricarboxylate transporter substrate binding protein [Roseomonas sp. KE0001]
MPDPVPVSRRRALLALGAALPLARPALAQAYPSRPLRLIVGFGAGGISDLVARLVAEAAGQAMGQTVVVENRTGAGGNIAAEAAARAAPDGYTLLFASPSLVSVNPILMPGAGVDVARELEPVLPLASTPHVLVVRPQSGLRDLPAFLARARAGKGEMNWSTAGVGTAPHQTMLLLQALGGTGFTPVHYRSGAAGVQAVLTGEVDVTSEATAVVVEHIRAGTLTGLVAAAPERLSLLPDVPTAAEQGLPGLRNGSIAGLMVPRGTPPARREALRAGFAQALGQPALQHRLAQQGTIPLQGDAEAFGQLIAAETARWRPLLAGLSAG